MRYFLHSYNAPKIFKILVYNRSLQDSVIRISESQVIFIALSKKILNKHSQLFSNICLVTKGT